MTINNTLTSGHSFKFCHLIIQCLRNKLLELEILSQEHGYHPICLIKHLLSEKELFAVNIQGFSVVSSCCRTQKWHDRVCILEKNEVYCVVLLLINNYSEDINFKDAGIVFNNVHIITVYRSPLGNLDILKQNLSVILFQRSFPHLWS